MKIKQVEGLQAAIDESVTIDPGDIEFVSIGDIPKFVNNETKEITTSGVKIDDSAAASNQVLWTSSKFGNSALKNVGTTAGTVCAGDDSRLGGTPANPADNSVTHIKFHTSLKNRSAVSASEIDWSSAAIFTKTLTAATTLTFTNLQLNKVITLLITGNYTLTLPTYCNRISGTYNGAVSNYISMHCVNSAEGNEEVWYTISQEAS